MNKTKKIMAIASLGLALGMGIGIGKTGQVAQAQQAIRLLDLSYRGVLLSTSLDDKLDALLRLYNSGTIGWEEYNLVRDYLLASVQNKQSTYERLIDYYVRVGVLSYDQGLREKSYGYRYDLDYDLVRVNNYTYFDTIDDDDIEIEITFNGN